MTSTGAATEPRGREDGITLVEVLVAASITLVVLAFVVSATISGYRVQAATDAEATGQFDVRTTIERLGRDVRNARGVDPGATPSKLVMWIDSNSDYVKQAGEVVTWELTAAGGGQFQVKRSAGGGGGRLQSRLVVDALAFCYKKDAAQAACAATPLTVGDAEHIRVVESSVTYDAVPGAGTGNRRAVFSERLRNVE